MSNKRKSHLRELFIINHFEEIQQLINEGKPFSMRIADFVNNKVRPALNYSRGSDTDQIWTTLRKHFARIKAGKQTQGNNP